MSYFSDDLSQFSKGTSRKPISVATFKSSSVVIRNENANIISKFMKNGQYLDAIMYLTMEIDNSETVSLSNYYNRSVCFEKCNEFGRSLQDALEAFSIAERRQTLSLRLFRRVAIAYLNVNQIPEAKRTLVQADLFESKTCGAYALLSESGLCNEKIKIADLKRKLNRIMLKGFDGASNATFGAISPVLVSQLSGVPTIESAFGGNNNSIRSLDIKSAFSDLDCSTDDDIGEDSLVKSMTIWDARKKLAEVKKIQLQHKKKQKCLDAIIAKRDRKINFSFEDLERLTSVKSIGKLKAYESFRSCNNSPSMLSNLPSMKGFPLPTSSSSNSFRLSESNASSPKKPKLLSPIVAGITKGSMKKTEFPTYVNSHSKYVIPNTERTTLINTIQRLEQNQNNSHEKYVFKDKMQLCRLVSVLGRDNNNILEEQKVKPGSRGSEDDNDDDEEEEEDDDEDDDEEEEEEDTRETEERIEAPPTSRYTYDILQRHKSIAIQLLDKKMKDNNFDTLDGRVRFPGLIS